MTHEANVTLVLGGTGKTGRRVVERLAARGLPTRVGSRSGEPPFDWEDRATWAPALDGVGSAYISYYPDIAVPGRSRERSASFADAGRRERRHAARAAVRARRARGGARRAGRARLGRRADGPTLEAGSTRTSARTTSSTWCWTARSPFRPGTRGAVRRRRRHRRRRRRRADRRQARRPGVRAHRAAPADLRRGGRRRSREATGPRDPLRAGLAGRLRSEHWPSRAFRPTSSTCSRTCSARCWTGATPTWQTASSARSGGSRGTSATTRGRRPPRASGLRSSPEGSDMARTGQTLVNPASGERITFRTIAAETNGELVAIDLELPPGGRVPGFRHVHPRQEERFEVVGGNMRFRVRRRRILAGPGQVVIVPPGVPHDFANAATSRRSSGSRFGRPSGWNSSSRRPWPSPRRDAPCSRAFRRRSTSRSSHASSSRRSSPRSPRPGCSGSRWRRSPGSGGVAGATSSTDAPATRR